MSSAEEQSLTIERSLEIAKEKEVGWFMYSLDINLKYARTESKPASITATFEGGHGQRPVMGKGSWEREFEAFGRKFTAELELQLHIPDAEGLIEGVAGKRKASFLGTFKTLQGTVKGELGIVMGLPIELAGGLELSKMPIVIKVICQIPSSLGKGTVEGELHIGPSKAAWRRIAARVSKNSLVGFLQEQRYIGVLRWLVANGIVEFAAGAAGTVALVAVGATVIHVEKRNAQVAAIESSAYRSAYLKAIFGSTGLAAPWQRPSALTGEELRYWTICETAGATDARQNARRILVQAGIRFDSRDPEEALMRYMLLLRQKFGSDRNAFEYVRQWLNEQPSAISARQ